MIGYVGIHASDASCPIDLSPPSVVVKYGASVSVNCTTTTSETHEGMGWEATNGGTDQMEDVTLVVWNVANLTDWDPSPICYINIGKQCEKTLPVVVYSKS